MTTGRDIRALRRQRGGFDMWVFCVWFHEISPWRRAYRAKYSPFMPLNRCFGLSDARFFIYEKTNIYKRH